MKAILNRLRRKAADTGKYCGMVVPAAGNATRMQGIDKIIEPLDGIPVLIRTLIALDSCEQVSEIVVTTREDLIVPISQLCHDFSLAKVRKIVVGGDTRTRSVFKGMQELSPEVELIGIHDGARPLLSQAVLDEVIRKAAHFGAAAPAIPIKDTIKEAQSEQVVDTPDRSRFFAVQTPQVFEADLIKGALTKAIAEEWEITDDCSAVERLGMSVYLTHGAEENIKVTTPMDLILAEAILQWQNGV